MNVINITATFFKQGSISIHQTVTEAYNIASSITTVNLFATFRSGLRFQGTI